VPVAAVAAAADDWFAFVYYMASNKRLCCRDAGRRCVPEDLSRQWLDGATALIVADSAASISFCNGTFI